MHYLMIEPDDMMILLHTQSAVTMVQYKAVISNFINRYEEVSSSTSIKDLKPEVEERLKGISGETHPLKFARMLARAKSGKADNDVQREMSFILKQKDSYDGDSEVSVPEVSTSQIRNTDRLITEQDGGQRYKLTPFQAKLLKHIYTNSLKVMDKEMFMLDIDTKIERVKMQYKVPALWGIPLKTVMGYLSPYFMANKVEDSLSDYKNKLDQLKQFEKNYLQEDREVNTLDKELFKRYEEEARRPDTEFKDLVMRLIEDLVQWDYEDINNKLGTMLSEYEMMIDIVDLEVLGFLGIWFNSRPTVEHLISSSKFNRKMEEVQREDLLNNENILFLINVVKPILEGEVRYLNEF